MGKLGVSVREIYSTDCEDGDSDISKGRYNLKFFLLILIF
jgi:hypothetical protein